MNAATPLETLRQVSRDPSGYITQWRAEHPSAKVLGVMPMNFPREFARAAGALPSFVQDDQKPITEGRGMLAEFYCGFTRNIADQAATGRLDVYDAILTADHCIQIVGATDVARVLNPDKRVYFGMLISSLSDSWSSTKVAEMMDQIRVEIEALTGTVVTADALRASIAAYNKDKALLRSILDQRSSGAPSFTSVEILDLVASAQIMDPDDHYSLLERAVLERSPGTLDERVRVHLSGHMCHAPRRELLEVIEDSGAIVVDDDLWTGRRYIQTNVDETLEPFSALAAWYLQRNVSLPCPTRVQHEVAWDEWLVEKTRTNGAEAVIHLMPKFCEPHMLYYPELRRALDTAGIPQLLVETEHDGLPLETIRTRVESMVERALRKRPAFA